MRDDFYAIGLMSGTSLDGLDICYSTFSRTEDLQWGFEISCARTITYPAEIEEKLRKCTGLAAIDLFALHSELGFYFGKQIQQFIGDHHISKLDVISSHGHTVFHQPGRKLTVQIGDGRAIKILNNFPVVYDFRSQDVLMGGNGAPLVPIGDRLLFGDYDACLNLGGFSNISMEKNGKRIAFDICPVNIVMNSIAQKLGKKYDEGGKLAAAGKIDYTILNDLNSLSFYNKQGPKSLGIEWVQKHIFPLTDELNGVDALATFTEHAAEMIARVITEKELKEVLITGGGAYNNFLIEKIKKKTIAKIIVPDPNIIEYKEALIFAFMGVLRLQNINNVISSATGSSKDHCTGLLI